MKTRITLVAIVTTFVAAGTLAQLTNAQAPARSDQAAAAARGAKAWADNCASCHNNRSPLEKGDAQWSVAVAHMRVRANLPGNVANDILVFLQASNGQKGAAPLAAAAGAATSPVTGPPTASSIAGNPAHGATVYNETCVACHGANGKGAIEEVPDLRQRLTQSDAALLRHTIDGFQSSGSPMPMPARGGNPDLSDQDLADALAYIRTLYGQATPR